MLGVTLFVGDKKSFANDNVIEDNFNLILKYNDDNNKLNNSNNDYNNKIVNIKKEIENINTKINKLKGKK